MRQQKFVKKDGNAAITEQKNIKKGRRRWVFYVALFVTLIVIFAALFVFLFMKVSSINIEGDSRYTDEEILAASGIVSGQNLTELLSGKEAELVERRLPYVESCEISVHLPSTVEIKITEAKPYVYMVIGDDCYLLSKELKVLERVELTDTRIQGLVRVYAGTVSRCVIGDVCTFADSRESDMITEIMAEVEQNQIYPAVVYIDVTNRFGMYLNYEDRFSVYIGSIDSIGIKMQFLVKIVNQFESHETGTIDLSNHKEAAVHLDD